MAFKKMKITCIIDFLIDPLKPHFYYISTGLRESFSHEEISMMEAKPLKTKSTQDELILMEIFFRHVYRFNDGCASLISLFLKVFCEIFIVDIFVITVI